VRNSCRGFSWLALALASFVVVAAVLFALFPPGDEAKDAPLPPVDYKKRFDWGDTLPYLRRAAALRPEEAVRVLLQNSVHLRTYVAIEFSAGCGSDGSRPFCNAQLGDPVLESEITSRIEEEIKARLRMSGQMTSADVAFPRQPFPLTLLIALKSNSSPYASLVASLPRGNGLTLARVIERYGEPHEERISADARILVYKAEADGYSNKMEFTVNANTGETRSVAVSLQRL